MTNIIKKIINVLTTLIIVFGGIFLGLYILGIVPYVVLSGSMEPTIETGSLCFINKHAKFSSIKKKDVIAYRMKSSTLVTHRVVKIDDTCVVTKGDNNKNDDGCSVTSSNFMGKNIFWIPKVGYLVMAFQSTKGKIILITCIILLLVVGFLFGDDKKNKEVKKEEVKEE